MAKHLSLKEFISLYPGKTITDYVKFNWLGVSYAPPKQLIDIEVTALVEEAEVGTAIKDLLIVNAVYDDGSTRRLSQNEYQVWDDEVGHIKYYLTEGANNITVHYFDYRKTVVITGTITPEPVVPVYMSITGHPIDATIGTPVKTLLQVTLVYSDGSERLLEEDEYTTNIDYIADGPNYITAYYLDFTAECTIAGIQPGPEPVFPNFDDVDYTNPDYLDYITDAEIASGNNFDAVSVFLKRNAQCDYSYDDGIVVHSTSTPGLIHNFTKAYADTETEAFDYAYTAKLKMDTASSLNIYLCPTGLNNSQAIQVSLNTNATWTYGYRNNNNQSRTETGSHQVDLTQEFTYRVTWDYVASEIKFYLDGKDVSGNDASASATYMVPDNSWRKWPMDIRGVNMYSSVSNTTFTLFRSAIEAIGHERL